MLAQFGFLRMQPILDKLRARLVAASDNDLLKNTIAVVEHVQRHPHGPFPVHWDDLHRDFQRLRDDGLWDASTENDDLLDALRIMLTSKEPPLDEKISVVMPPAQSLSSRLISNQGHLVLPVELIHILDDAYFLHVLVTDPTQVLPPGKSLLSVMLRSRTTADADLKPTIHNKVGNIVHKAFWDEAVSTLSNPEPSTQLPRIKLLYGDLHVTLSPLLPPSHPVLLTLSSPLSPTSSPLDSALGHLREVLASLRQRCAPIRDTDIEALERSLDEPSSRTQRSVALATLVADTVRNILALAETMKDDLSQFVLGNMTEKQLGSVVAKQAKTTEREVVINIWHRDRIMQGWSSWLDRSHPSTHLAAISAESYFSWIVHIVQALGSSLPVSCPLPSRTVQISPTGHDDDETEESCTTDGNTLPPVFFFSAPTLLKIQNYLQALVIAASLSALARLPTPVHPPRASTEPPNPASFMSRIWTLLRADIAGEPDAGDTKLINLADEVVRTRTHGTAMPSTLAKEEEATLRAAVNRTLRCEDPVYMLLQRRLLTELVHVLIKRRQGDAAQDVGPVTLRTGRDRERARKRPRLVLDLEDVDESTAPPRSSPQLATDVKGFEDPVLSRAIAEVFGQVDNCLWWVERVWGDVVETGNVKDEVDSKSDK